jgi:hypothetical protein
MPGYTDEQHRRFYEKTGRWHYSAPEHIKKPTKERPLSAIEQSAMRVGTQTFGDTGIPGEYPGSALARNDSLSLGLIQKPEKPYDPSVAIQDSIAARLLRGDTAGAAKLRLPPERSFSEQLRDRALRNLDSGKPLSPGEQAVIKTGGTGDDDKAESEYEKAMSRANTIAAKLSRIDALLNAPGDTYTDELGGTKYIDRPALTKERETLVREQRHYHEKTAAHDLGRELPPAQHNGRTVTDRATGFRYRSDGKKWTRIE